MKHYWLYAATAAAMFATSCKEAYDLDERLPDDFGTTLYSYLESHNYQNVKRLVDDLGYSEELAGRSLKTMFVADDEAFERFYASNPWGVHSYDDLSLAQKKLLLNSSMLDNSLQIMNLSNTTGTEGYVTGNAMRRSTAQTVYDSIPVLTPAEMPDNRYWARFKDEGRSIVCMRDMTTAPMTFFTEPFLVQNRITNDDINFIYNNAIDRKAGDAGVSGIAVVDPNIRCANGFIHRMADVLVPQENMAEMLRTTPDLSQWSRFIERFSVPYYVGRTITDNINFEYGTQIDSVFQKRYFSVRSQGGAELLYDPDEMPVEAQLKFDPGWNGFYSDDPNAVSVSSTVAMQKNMGVMLVPDNAALDEYWNNGAGQVLRDYYGTWDRVPDHVLVKLLNNNMLNSFVGSVPSKFSTIVNSTKDPMGIKKDDVSRVQLACNGAIYVTNKVFSPTEYVSVSFPALVNESMNIINWIIEQKEYSPYLNSIESYYSFFIPTNNALQHYVDPWSWSKPVKEVWKFHYKADAATVGNRVWASVFAYDPETGLATDSLREERGGSVIDRLKDLLDNHIVVGNIETGRDWYQTKNGNMLRVKRNGGQIEGVMGSMQVVDKGGAAVPIAKIYDQSKEGNGKSYILEDEPLMTTRKSVMDIIDESGDSIFLGLLQGCKNLYKTSSPYSVGDIATFNHYNYTVYVPTDESMAEYLASGDLKTWEQISEMEDNPNVNPEQVEYEREKIESFLRYHIQDNSVFIGQEFAVDGSVTSLDRNYETSVMNLTTNKFYTIRVQADTKSITLTDGTGKVRHVLTEKVTDYNQPAREIGSSSFAVVHRIDKPLFYDQSQCVKYNK